MSTRTAIFKEVELNQFEGIYVHCDGFIEYTGAMLIKYYQENNDILDIIREYMPISRIGSQTDIIYYHEDKERYFEDNEEGFPKYTGTNFVEGESKYEWYRAESWEEIRNFEYKTYDEKGDIQGFYHKGEFIPYSGSDNNGIIYVQDINGEWFVSREDDSQREMEFFKPLKQVVENQ